MAAWSEIIISINFTSVLKFYELIKLAIYSFIARNKI